MPGEAHFSGHTDQETLDEFDRLFDCGPGGSRSRSDALEHAIKLAISIERARQSVGWDYENDRAMRSGIVAAVYQLDQIDARREDDA